jgi:hypothetical protein
MNPDHLARLMSDILLKILAPLMSDKKSLP